MFILPTTMSELQSPSKPELKLPLTNLQAELVTLFPYNVPDAELLKIRDAITSILLDYVNDLVDAEAEERGYTNETRQEWLQTHMRTAYNLPSNLSNSDSQAHP
jgi:hypothetical protein